MKWISILMIFLALGFAASNSFAKSEKSYSISLNVFKYIEKANLLAQEEQFAEALLVLTELLEKRSSKYEKAQIHNLMGSIYYRMSKYDKAIESFKSILDSVGSMPLMLHKQTLKTLAQLTIMKEDYQQAKMYCQLVIDIVGEDISPVDYALLAQANYKLEDWSSALDAGYKGRELSLSTQMIPEENLLLLLNAIHFELQQSGKMASVLKELIKYYPKTSYILYLAYVYGQSEQLDKQTVLMESLYEDGRLNDESQLRNLASLYMSEKTPYKGALVLEKALKNEHMEASAKNFEMLAQAWRSAAEREKAINALAQAASLSENGDTYLHKAYLHFDLAQWEQTQESLSLGLDKGFSKKLNGEVWLLMCMTRFKMKQYNNAIEACQKAKEHEKATKNAEQWITYISTEKQKIDSMQNAFN